MKDKLADRLSSGDRVVVLGGIHKGSEGEVRRLVGDEWSGSIAYEVGLGHMVNIVFSRGELDKVG